MPISIGKFADEGKDITRRFIQENIMRILDENPEIAVSSKELGEILEATPQTINQALRSLEDQSRIVRGLIQDEQSGQMVAYAMEASHARMVKERMEETDEDSK